MLCLNILVFPFLFYCYATEVKSFGETIKIFSVELFKTVLIKRHVHRSNTRHFFSSRFIGPPAFSSRSDNHCLIFGAYPFPASPLAFSYRTEDIFL